MRILKSILSKTNGYYHAYRSGKYKIEHMNADLSGINEILKRSFTGSEPVKVNSLIRANGINLQSSPEATRKILGKPTAFYYHPENPGFLSLLYVTKFLNHNVQSYFHYYKKKLFLGENQFYIMSSLDNDCLFSILNNKFGTQLDNLKSPVLMEDPYGNKLLAQQDVYINLFYIAADTTAISDLIDEHSPERIRENNRQEQISEWMEKI